MPKNEIFAKFAKQLQADGMPLSVGVLYNNMHNQEFFDNLYGILQADGMQMDKQTFAKNLGLGTISSDYKTLGIDGKPNQVPTKTTPTTPKVTPITTQQPKPTAVVPNFNIPSVVKDIKTDERIVNSPIPSATSIETVPVKPSTLDVSKVEAKAKIQEQAFKGGYYPTGEEQPLIFEGKQYNENIAPIKREALPKYDKLFIDDILGDNANFTDKYNNTYLEKSDIEYQKKQSSQSGYNEFNYTKSNYDRQFNALKEYESKLNQSISNKFNTSDILTDIQKENESLNSELSKLEKLKSANEPLLKSIESDITLLDNRYQNGQIDENAYRAEFAALKARHETINQEVNKKTSAIQEQQRQFQSKYSDKEVSDLLRVKQKQFEVAKEGANIINDPKFAKIKEGEAKTNEAQKVADNKKKLEIQLQNKEIDFNKYATEVEKLDKAKNVQINTQAFIADKTWNLFSQILTLPRTISGNFENNYGFVDKVADWANHMSEVKQKKNPYSSDIQVNTFQKFAQVGDLRVLLDEKGNAYDVRDNRYFSIDQQQAEQALKQYNENKKGYKIYNQTNADAFTKNALSTIADVGILILGTKGLGSLAGGGKLASTLIGGGVAFTQIQNDLYKQGIESGLNPQDASQFATKVGTSISLISFINPTEYKLAGAGGLFPSIRQNVISQADVALINSGEMSITQIASKYAKGIAKNIVGENFEELIGEPLAQDLISNLYESRIANDGEGFTKQFDPISKQGLETLLLTSVVAIPFGAAEVTQEMPHYQAMAMQSAIENPQAYIDVLKKRKEMGIIDDAQMNAQLLQMQEISEVYNSISSEIKDERKPELAGLLAKKNVALNKIKDIKDDVLSNNWKSKLEKINEDIQAIVDNVATKNNMVASDGIESDVVESDEVESKTKQKEPIKVFSDFDNTLFDPTTQTLTPLGEEMKLRIEAGEDIEIVTARDNTKENVDLISGQLGIDPAKITLGLTPEMKAEKVDEFERKSQFIDDNTDNLQAVEGLGNDNVEVVPIVSKKQELFSRLSAQAKTTKEAKKIEKEQLAKSQEIPLNEKGEVDLPKIAADAIEVKTEVVQVAKETHKAIIAEIKAKNLTHVRGKGMGENQSLGTFISTEESNRYETPTQKAEKVDVEIENPLVVDDDYGLVGKRQEILNENRDKFTAEDSNDYQDLPNKKLTLDDLNDDGIKKLASLTTEALKAQGYDSIYFRESDTQEGELVVFDKKKVTFKENNIKLAENEKQQSEPGEKSINPISKDSVQKDTKKDETKTITKRKGTPKSRRQIRNPEYLKALSHEVLDVVDYVKQVIIGGATVQPIVIQQLFTTDRRNSNAGRDKSLAEKRSRIGILDKNGYPTISAFAHALWSNQVDKFGYEKFDTQQFENAIEEVISNFVGTRKLVDELNEMYDISDEKRYELERGSQGYSEYSDLVDETQYEQEDIDNAINMFENLSDEEIKRIESGSDAFLDRLVNDYLVAEYGEILNKGQNKPEEKKPSKNSPELISINKKIEEAEAEITKSNERLKDKIKELDKAITEDNADLFGNRKSERETLFEGSERVDLKQREKILEPLKNSVLKAKENLNKLKKKKQDIVDGKVESTGEITFKEDTTITPSKTNRKVLDEKLREEIDNALDEFKKTLGNLNIGVNPETLIKGTKLVALYTKAGVYKFSDVISDIYAKFGEISKEFFDGIKQSYSAYYSTADNNIADQMDGNIRGITYESIIDKIKQENGNNNQQQSEKQGESSPIGTLQPNSKRLSKREPQESLFEPNKRGKIGTRSQSQSKPIFTTTTDVEQPTTGQGDLLSTNVGVLEAEGKTAESKQKDKVEVQIEQINQAEKQEPALVDFAMQDNEQDKFSATKKYTDNINALETLLNIIKEKRKATAEEKNILAKYVGFGGLKEIAFSPDNDTDWKESTTKYKGQVRKVMELTKELDQALGINNSLAEIRAGILTAHYTPKTIIDTMFNVLERLGFKNGNILEPSAGIGNFIGYMPSKMRSNSKINAVELDNITGSILKYLYDDVNTQITGIQDALILDNSQDVVISNVPFGAFKVFDKAFKGTREFLTKRIHNYFFAKALDKVREGGIVMFVTSKGVLDSKGNREVREYLNKNADFLGAVRLPSTAFQNNANTSVVTDVIILRKNTTGEKKNPNFIDVVDLEVTDKNGEIKTITINKFFAENRNVLLGDIVPGGMYSEKDYSLIDPDNKMGQLWERLASSNLRNYFGTYEPTTDLSAINRIETNQNLLENTKVGNLTINKEGKVLKRLENEMKEINMPSYVSPKNIKKYIDTRIALFDLITAEYTGQAESVLDDLRKKLNSLYSNAIQTIPSKEFNRIATEDGDGFNVLALTDKSGKRADILSRRTINPLEQKQNTDNIDEAIIISLYENAKIDMERISDLMQKPVKEILEIAKGKIFESPIGGFFTRDEYLSGNVKKKLSEVLQAIENGYTEFENNKVELEAVIPKDIPVVSIEARLGSRWVPLDIINDFAQHLFNDSSVNINYAKSTDTYNNNGKSTSVNAIEKWGTKRRNGLDLLIDALHIATPAIYDITEDKKRILNKEETEKAINKYEEIRTEFENWIYRDAERRERLGQIYNEKYNTTVRRKYDGSHLNIPGINGVNLYPHQKDAIWMLLQNNGGIIDHIVGGGKTFVMVAGTAEMKRTGVAKKPMILALKSTIPQIVETYKQSYPLAKILAPSEKDFQSKNRQQLFSQIALNDWDVIIMSHENFNAIPHRIENLTKQIDDEIAEIEAERDALSGDKKALSGLETRLKNLEARLQKLTDIAKDNSVKFQEMGIDHIMVDESQQFKNLAYMTKQRNVAGLSKAEGSRRAFNLLVGMRYLQEVFGSDKGTTFLSGTPISNSMVEMYSLLKYMRPNKMKELGFDTFDQWATTFANPTNEIEYTVTGQFKSKTRFREFINVPELSLLYNEIADVRNDDNLVLDKPKMKGGGYTTMFIPMNDEQRDYGEKIIQFAKTKDGSVLGLSLSENQLQAYMLLATNLSSKMAIDMRLINKDFAYDPNGKVGKMTDEILKVYTETNEHKGTQLVFSDLGTPKNKNNQSELLKDYLEDELGIPHDTLVEIFGNYTEEGYKIPSISVIKQKLIDVLEVEETDFDEYLEQAKQSGDTFNLYSDIKQKLIDKGIPENEIAFIHDYNNQKAKEKLFEKVNNGEIRVVLGSTQKLGTGVNVQYRLAAIHHLDVPWRPSDMEQRNGRGIRQGNWIAKMHLGNVIPVYAYATERTLDGYKYQLLQTKQRFLDQVKSGNIEDRTIRENSEDGNDAYAIFVAELSGNKDILTKFKLEQEKERLIKQKRNFDASLYEAQGNIRKIESNIPTIEENITKSKEDIESITNKAEYETTTDKDGVESKKLKIDTINGEVLQPEKDSKEAKEKKPIDRTEYGKKAIELINKTIKTIKIGEYTKSFELNNIPILVKVTHHKDIANGKEYTIEKVHISILSPSGKTYTVNYSQVAGVLLNNIQKTIEGIPNILEIQQRGLEKNKKDLSQYKELVKNNTFPKEEELSKVSDELKEIDKKIQDFEKDTTEELKETEERQQDNKIRIGDVVYPNFNEEVEVSMVEGKNLKTDETNYLVRINKKLDYQNEYKKVVEPLMLENKGEWNKSHKSIIFSDKSNAKFVVNELKKRLGLETDLDSEIKFQIENESKPFETNNNTKATKENLTKTFPDAVVVQSESELPIAIQDEIKQQRAEGKVKGVFYNGKVYMVVDNIKTIGEATGTYRHEKLGHKGVIDYLKDKLDTYANRIIDSAKGEQLGKLKQLAKRYGFPTDLNKLTPKQKSDLGQEYIAMISENKSKYPKLWNDLVSFVREAIRMFGIKLSVTETEIQSLIGKVEKIEKTNNDLTKNGKSQFQLSEDTSQKFDPKNKIHVEYSDMLNEYVDISIEEGVVPTLELLKSEIDEETFDELVSELGIPFIEGKFNTPFIQNLKLENLSKEQKDNPLVERAQITLGEDARQELDEIGRTYTADKWKEIEPQVDAFVQRVLGSRNFNESVLEIIQWMKDMPMSTYLNEDGIATAHTMILNKLSMHAYTIDKELFKEVFKFSKIRATSFGQAIAAYAEASTPESLFNNAIADIEIEKEEILNTVQPNGKTLKQELDLILEQISIKADEITEVLNAIDATTQNVANKTKGKTNKPSGSKPSTSKTKSNFVPRSKEEKAKAKVKIDDAKTRLAKWLEKQSTLSFAYDPKADLKAHEELLGISKDFVLGFLQYGYSSILNIKEKLQAVLGKNANVDDFWHEVYDEEVRAKVKDLEKEQIVNAIVNAIKEPGDAKEVNAISQISRILAGVARNKGKSDKTTVPIEEKVRLLFENKDVASKAVEEALRIGIEQIKNNPKLSDAQKLERTTTLQDLASNFTVVPESVSRKAIQAGLKDIKETIESIAKKHYLDAEDAKQSLIDKLVLNAGLSHEDAKEYADILSNELDKQIGEKKAKLLDKLLNPKTKKAGNKKEIEKIIDAINLGALSSNEFSNLFAEKFGFRALTPQQVQFLQNTISIMFQQKGIMKRRIARTLADYIASLKPLDARNVGMLIQEIFYQHALGGINTVAMNIPIGSTLSVMANMLPVMIKNPMLFVKANLAYNRAGLGGTGIKAFIDTIQTGFNDVDNFVDEKNFLTSGSRYHKFLLSWGFKDPQNFITSVLYKLPMHIGYFASAFDNLINHRGGEILNYMHEYQSTDKSYLTIKEIHKQVEAKMGYNDAKNYSTIVNDEILDMKANGLTIPTGYKEQRVKELMVETRDRDIQQQAYRLIRSYGLMGKPDGISGAIYKAIAPAGIINDKDSNLTAVVKTIASITLLPFLRISFASMGMLASGIPVIGMGLGSYKLEKNEQTKRNEFSFKSAEELKQLAGIQVMTIGALIFGFMEMFDMEDDEKGNTVLSLNKNRSFDITGTNISFFDQDKMQLDKGNYLPLSIRFRKSDGTWGKLHEAGRYMPPIVAIMSILGNLRDKIEIQSLSKLDEEGEIKTTYANKEMVFESLMSIYGGLTVTSYNSLAQFTGKSADIIGYKNKSPQIQSDKKIEDTKKLLFNTIARPVKTLALPNIYRDATKNTEALLGSQKTMDSQYKNILKDFYGLDHLTNHKEVDIFGNKVMQTASFGEDDRYNLPEWKLLRERNITFDTPYFYKTAKFDGEKKSITNEQRLKLNDKASIAFGNYIRDNIEYLNGLTQIELIQEFDNYADQAKRDITSLDFNEAIK